MALRWRHSEALSFLGGRRHAGHPRRRPGLPILSTGLPHDATLATARTTRTSPAWLRHLGSQNFQCYGTVTVVSWGTCPGLEPTGPRLQRPTPNESYAVRNDWLPARCKGQRVLPEHHGVSSPRTGIWRRPLGLRLSALAMWGGSGDGERAASSQNQTSGNPPSPDAQGKRKGTFFCNRQVPRPRSPSSTLRQSSGPSARLNSSRHRTQTATAPREPVPSGGQFGLWKAGGRGGGSVPLPPPLRWSGPTRNMLILKQSAFGSSHEKLNVGVVS